MKWISYRHDFGAYFHLIKGYYNCQTCKEPKVLLEQLIRNTKEPGNTLYIDTMISPVVHLRHRTDDPDSFYFRHGK